MRGKGDRDAVSQNDLRRGRREVLRCEAPVIGDDDALRGLAPVHHVAGDAVRASAHVLERELVGDPGPPTVGPEHDGRGRRGLTGHVHFVSPPVPNSAR